MPNITILFHNGLELPLLPKAYLFRRPGPHLASGWCLGVADGGPAAATFGAIFLRDVALTIDNARRELRFRPVSSCDTIADAAAAAMQSGKGGYVAPAIEDSHGTTADTSKVCYI
jgi:hypothetical protein